ncbi:hypothetical protein ADK60_09705 [Streptomyces sp. XY431]|nr:hypothetical protein ADK60_09705 [Streptomyces sp. XY431]
MLRQAAADGGRHVKLDAEEGFEVPVAICARICGLLHESAHQGEDVDRADGFVGRAGSGHGAGRSFRVLGRGCAADTPGMRGPGQVPADPRARGEDAPGPRRHHPQPADPRGRGKDSATLFAMTAITG